MNISENNFGRAKLDMFLGPLVLRENILLPLFELHLGKCRLSTPESFKMRGGFPPQTAESTENRWGVMWTLFMAQKTSQRFQKDPQTW